MQEISPNMIFNPAMEIALLKSVCQQSFYRFFQEFWHLASTEKLQLNWHHEYICQKLQELFEDVEAGRPKKHDLVINIPPGSGKCEVAGNPVFTPKGYVPIEQLDLGEDVISIKEGVLCSQKIISKGSYYADCVTIHTDLGNSRTYSGNHPFMTQRGWVCAEDLTTEDFVQTLCAKVDTNDRIPDAELDFITLMLFEGSTTGRSKKFTNFDPQVVNVMEKACSDLGIYLVPVCNGARQGQFAIRDSKEWDKNVKQVTKKTGKSSQLLIDYGLYDCLAKHKRLPQKFYTMPFEQKCRFVGLMAATDGWVNRAYSTLYVGLSSKGLIEDIKRLLATMGVMSTVVYKRNTIPDKKTGERKKFDSWELCIHRETCSELFKYIDCLHKQSKIKKSKQRHSVRWYYPTSLVLDKIKNGVVTFSKSQLTYRHHTEVLRKGGKRDIRLAFSNSGKISRVLVEKLLPLEPALHELYISPCRWDKVKNVTDAGRQRVYNIGVESANYDNQNYFSDNTLVHNSSLASVLFPAWCHSRMPQCRFITASFSLDIAQSFALQSRQVLKSPLFVKCFGRFKFFPERKAHYMNQYKGERMVYTTAQSPTGQHAHFILIDDPIEPMAADKDFQIANINMWMNRVIRSRTVKADVTPLILIMQRLSESDPTGEWLEKSAGNEILHIRLPASLDDNSPVNPPGLRRYYMDGLLDPIRLPRHTLEGIRKRMSASDFSAQYQQEPMPSEGLMFKVQNIQVQSIDPLDPVVNKVRYWDKAISTKVNAAFTAGTLMGKTASGRFVILDVQRGQWDAATRERMILNIAKSDGPATLVGIEIEPGPVWEEEQVRMAGGTRKKLKDVCDGDWVINASGNATQVVETHVQGTRECRKIALKSGRVVHAALDHPFLTTDGWAAVEKLVEGGILYRRLFPETRSRNMFPDRIVRIDDAGDLPCRCLTVVEGASFLANDFVVHNSGGIESAQYTIRNLAGFMVHADRASQSKEARAEPMAIQVEHGNVFMTHGAWNTDFISELAQFPQGKLKDQVDSAVGAFNLLSKAGVRKAGALF